MFCQYSDCDYYHWLSFDLIFLYLIEIQNMFHRSVYSNWIVLKEIRDDDDEQCMVYVMNSIVHIWYSNEWTRTIYNTGIRRNCATNSDATHGSNTFIIIGCYKNFLSFSDMNKNGQRAIWWCIILTDISSDTFGSLVACKPDF